MLRWLRGLVGQPPRESGARPAEVVVGALYAARNAKKGDYSIYKVLAYENGVVHVRLYANSFSAPPDRIDPSTLDLGRISIEQIQSGNIEPFGIGHMPYSIDMFASLNPRFVQQEPVEPDELDGIQEWKAAGGGVFG